MDVDRPEETSTIVRGLNASTRYLFRVRASVQGLGDWSNTVEESTLGNGEKTDPCTLSKAPEAACAPPPHLQTWSKGIASPDFPTWETILVASPSPELQSSMTPPHSVVPGSPVSPSVGSHGGLWVP